MARILTPYRPPSAYQRAMLAVWQGEWLRALMVKVT